MGILGQMGAVRVPPPKPEKTIEKPPQKPVERPDYSTITREVSA